LQALQTAPVLQAVHPVYQAQLEIASKVADVVHPVTYELDDVVQYNVAPVAELVTAAQAVQAAPLAYDPAAHVTHVNAVAEVHVQEEQAAHVQAVHVPTAPAVEVKK